MAHSTRQSNFQPILSELRSIRELDLKGQNILMRVDANVPRSDDLSSITDLSRVRGFKDTVHYALDQGAHSVILLSHLDEGKPSDSLEGVARALPEILARPGNTPEVWFRTDYATEDARIRLTEEIDAFKRQNPNRGLVVLLENTRFNPGEVKGDPDFAAHLAKLGSIYINDAFGAAHRPDNASVCPLGKIFAEKQKAAIGFLMERELARVEHIMLHAKEPLVVVQSGTKIKTKSPILEALINGPAENITLILAGETGMALAAVRGLPIGPKGLSEEVLGYARSLDKAIMAKKTCEVLLPVDAKIIPVSVKPKEATEFQLSEVMPEGFTLGDIGPKTVERYRSKIASVLAGGGTIVVNGTMGIYENPIFTEGSFAIFRAVAALPASVDRLIGGGDTGGVVIGCGVPEKDVSSGGGALLEVIKRGPAAMAVFQQLRRN